MNASRLMRGGGGGQVGGGQGEWKKRSRRDGAGGGWLLHARGGFDLMHVSKFFEKTSMSGSLCHIGVGCVDVCSNELELVQYNPIWHRSQCCGVKWGARVLRVRSVSREEVWESAGVRGAWVGGCGCEAD